MNFTKMSTLHHRFINIFYDFLRTVVNSVRRLHLDDHKKIKEIYDHEHQLYNITFFYESVKYFIHKKYNFGKSFIFKIDE